MLAGIELDLSELWHHKKESTITASLALGVPLIFGGISAVLLLSLGSGWIGPSGSQWQFILGIGMSCAVTALPILILLMEKLSILREPIGQRILRYASLDDVAIWGVLALILLDWNRIERQAIFLAGFVFCSFLFRKLMRQLGESDRWYVALIWVAGCAYLADWWPSAVRC
jgi:Kef-type K+ transport system membrane component KefB